MRSFASLLLVLSGCSLPVNVGAHDAGLGAIELVVDLSGSMNSPLMPAEPSCASCSGDSCPVTCPTRARILRRALTASVAAHETTAWLGLTTFPDPRLDLSPFGCTPATSEAVPLSIGVADTPAALTAQNQLVTAAVANLGVTVPFTGGTPVSATLRFVGALPAVATSATARPRAVILLTDGIANCNTNNRLSCESTPAPAPELCTLGNNCVGAYCRAGYIDQDATVAAVRGLRAAGVRVAVITVGPVPAPSGYYNAVAREGGVPACEGEACTEAFFRGDDEVQLTAALDQLIERLAH